jgi:hypothetical protein
MPWPRSGCRVLAAHDGVMIEGPHRVNGVADLAFGAFVVTLVITFLWALGWHSAIRFTPTRVSVTKFLVTTSVAWADVTAVTIGYGLAIQLRDDSALKSVQFGGSLIGEFTRYPSYRPAASILRGALKLAGQEETTRTGSVQIASGTRTTSWWWSPEPNSTPKTCWRR